MDWVKIQAWSNDSIVPHGTKCGPGDAWRLIQHPASKSLSPEIFECNLRLNMGHRVASLYSGWRGGWGIWKQDEQFFKTFKNGPNPWQAASSAMSWTATEPRVPGHDLPWRRDPCRIDWQVIICPQWLFKCTRAWWTVWFVHTDFHVWFLSTPLNNVITG